MARKPKLDAVLAAAADDALAAVLEIAGDEAVGPHSGTYADADRLVTHRFKALVEGYAGWEWYATLARVPRGKAASVCEVGLLPGEGALLAPAWVPWAERVKPEELAAAAAEAEAGQGAAGNGTDADTAADDGGAPAPAGSTPAPAAQDDAGAASTGPGAAASTGAPESEAGGESQQDHEAGEAADPESERQAGEPGSRTFRRRTVRRRRNPRARRGSAGNAH